MDKKELEKKLQPYINELEQEGIKVKCLNLREVFEGSAFTPFYLSVCIPDVTEKNYDNIVDRVLEVVWKQIDAATRNSIFALNVVNECETEKDSCSVE